MARHRLLNRLPRRITGASAIEFAFVFPLLFAIIYGTVTYGYVYFLQQRINFIAQEAVRAAIAVAPCSLPSCDYTGAITLAVTEAINSNFTLAGGAKPDALKLALFAIDAATNTVSIQLTYELKAPVLFPQMVLPMGVGSIPPLPDRLQATAAGRLS
ncbi:MAG: pilus assembly protein [Nevskia sp.]|nr:pilus assembly protein [Nevskia sp.]